MTPPMTPQKINIVILAAGTSSRMRGQDKLALPIHGRPLLTHSLERAQAAEVGQVFVVLPAPDHPRAEFVPKGVTILAPETKGGMGDMIAFALTKASDCDAVIIGLADMPDIISTNYQTLAKTFAQTPTTHAVRFQNGTGKFGHPTLIARAVFDDLKMLSGDQGAKKILAQSTRNITHIPTQSDRMFFDIDTPEAFTVWQTRENLR